MLSSLEESAAISAAVSKIPQELLLKDEQELERLYQPTSLDYALKKQLWIKFFESDKNGTKFRPVDIYGGITSDAHFYGGVLKNTTRVAWLIAPVIDSSALIEEAFRFSFIKVRDGILNMPITEKTAPTILKAFQYFADRHLGPMIQRIDSRNLNVNADVGKVQTTDPREIQAKLDELKQKLIPTFDVTPKNVIE